MLTRKLVSTSLQMARRLNEAKMKEHFSAEVFQLCDLFRRRGYEARIVGGSVRDVLLGQQPKDIDLATTATPDEMICIFKEENIRYIETGLQHGTLTVHMQERDYEITTLRIDVETFGRAAKVEFVQDWRLDAERRDLTINSMSLDMDGILYDYFNGENHLQKREVCLFYED